MAELIEGRLVIDGIHHPWTPSDWQRDYAGEVAQSVRTADFERTQIRLDVPDDGALALCRTRKRPMQTFTVVWSEAAFMGLDMHDQLALLYQLQKPFWIQYDDEMSRQYARLQPVGTTGRAFFAPTFPTLPLGWSPIDQIDWTDCLAVNERFVNSGFVVHRPTGMVLFDAPLPVGCRVALGYTWRAHVRIVSFEIRPSLTMGRYVYGGQIVLQQVEPSPEEFDQWPIAFYRQPYTDESRYAGDEYEAYPTPAPRAPLAYTAGYFLLNDDSTDVSTPTYVRRTLGYEPDDNADFRTSWVTGIRADVFWDADSLLQFGDDSIDLYARVRAGGFAYPIAARKYAGLPNSGSMTLGGPTDLWGYPLGLLRGERTLEDNDLILEVAVANPTNSRDGQNPANWVAEIVYEGVWSYRGPDGAIDASWVVPSLTTNQVSFSRPLGVGDSPGVVALSARGTVRAALRWIGAGRPPGRVAVAIGGHTYAGTTGFSAFSGQAHTDVPGAVPTLGPGSYEETGAQSGVLLDVVDGVARVSFHPAIDVTATRPIAATTADFSIGAYSIAVAARTPSPTVGSDGPRLLGRDPEIIRAASPDLRDQTIDAGVATILVDDLVFADLRDDDLVVSITVRFQGRVSGQTDNGSTQITIDPSGYAPRGRTVNILGSLWVDYTVGGDDWGYSVPYEGVPRPTLQGRDVKGLDVSFRKMLLAGESGQVRNVVVELVVVRLESAGALVPVSRASTGVGDGLTYVEVARLDGSTAIVYTPSEEVLV